MGKYFNKKHLILYSGLGILFLYLFLNFDADGFIKSYMASSSAQEITYDYYVSPSGSDSNSGTSSDSPFKTVQKALNAAQPGQAIYLMPGDYYQDVISVRDGRPDSPIKITGLANAVVKGGGNDRVVEINHDYITLDGFTVDGLRGDSLNKSNYRDMLLYVVGKESNNGVTGLKILNMTLKNAGGECIRLKYFATDNEIAYNNISDCGVYDFKFNNGGKNGEGIYIGTAPEQLYKNPTSDIDKSNNNYIHDNIINTNGNEGVDIKEGSAGNIVEYNKISGQKDPESGGLDSRGDGNTFRYNEVSGSAGAGIRLGGDLYKGVQYGKNNNVYGNKLTDNKYGAIKVQASPQERICGNIFSGNGKESGDYGSDFNAESQCEGLIEPLPATTAPDIIASNSCRIVCETTGQTPADYAKLAVNSTQASSYDTRYGGCTAEKTLDNNMDTRWAAQGTNSWISYDLGAVKNISYLNISFYRGDQRYQDFSVEVSNDNANWIPVYEGTSNGNTSLPQKFDFDDVAARYIRIIGKGNTQNDWNSITETEIYGAN